MDKISTLDQLLEVLPNCSGQDYVDLVKRIELSPSDFSNFIQYNTDCYTRNVIDRTEKYELILLCWENGQDTPIHCHNSQECWVYTLQGSFIENRYSYEEDTGEMELEHSMQLNAGRFSYMNDDMGYHSLHNNYDGQTLSLHLYMNPIDECRIYDPETKELSWKTLVYDNELSSTK